jgi:DNA-binding NarL/FixJ family response regulator
MGERVALIDDHGLIAHTLSTALQARGVDVVLLDPAEDLDLVAEVQRLQAGLVLLDLDLGSRGEATPLIRPLNEGGARVVIVTGVSDRLRHAACVRAGAVGVVSKSSSFEELAASVELALHGEALLDRGERDQLLADLRAHEAEERGRLAPFEALTPREAEVLGLLVRGRNVEQISTEAVVSVATVRTQVRSILTKLGASSQVVAIAKAREAGWVPPQER